MPAKDFTAVLSNPSNFADYEAPKDPPPSAPDDFIPSQSFYLSSLKLFLSTGALSVLTAPLTTSYLTLQLSINPQKLLNATTVTIGSNAEISNRYRILLLNSLKNARNLPLKPVSLGSYREVFKELTSQGIKGLYKGNLCGVFYHWFGTTLKIKSAFFFEEKGWLNNKNREFTLFGIYTLIDVLLHPIQTIQMRLVLQNANRKLAPYRNWRDFTASFRRNWKGYYQGVGLHIPKNVMVTAALYLNLKGFNDAQNVVIASALSQILSYPIMTIMRRLMCQEKNVPCMLPIVYPNTRAAFQKILREEGVFKGFFRGFGGFTVVSSFMLALNFTYQETINF